MQKFDYYLHQNILLEQYESIYFFIPKVACSTLKKVCSDILSLEAGPGDLNQEVHEQDFPCVKQGDLRTMYSDYFKFGFVRNPWDRLVSCFHSKILTDRNINNAYFKNGVSNALSGFSQFKAVMNFKDFAVEIAKIPDSDSESHFLSQHKFITDESGKLMVDFLGRFENLEQDFACICKRIGLEGVKLPHLMKSANKKDYREHYDKNTKELIGERYDTDISMFDYNF